MKKLFFSNVSLLFQHNKRNVFPVIRTSFTDGNANSIANYALANQKEDRTFQHLDIKNYHTLTGLSSKQKEDRTFQHLDIKNYHRLTGLSSNRFRLSNQGTKKDQRKLTQTIVSKSNGSSKLKRTKIKIEETHTKMKNKMKELKEENIFTIPNGLCVARMGLTPVIGYLVLVGNYQYSLSLFVVAGITDMLDGYIARKFPSQKSMIGSFLDPAADKLLISTLFVTLTITGLIPVPLTALIVTRDALLMSAGFYVRYQSLPPPKTFTRYFNMKFATAQLSPTTISKANTAIQLGLVSASLGAPVFGYIDHPYLHCLWYLTALTTVLSGMSYMVTKDTYKFLSKLPSKKL